MYPRKRPRRAGLAATEFAICLPVLMLLLLGVVECCSMIFLKQSLSVAAYEAAHTAVLPEATGVDARRTATEVLADRGVRGATVSIVPGDLSGVAEGEFFEVRVSAPTEVNRTLPLQFFRGMTLSASAVVMKEI